MHDTGVVPGLIFLAIAIAVYFLPTIIAIKRFHRQTGVVVIINLFLGWTLVGWVVALAMAASAVPADTKVCPQCAETVKAAVRICHFCHYDFFPAPLGIGKR